MATYDSADLLSRLLDRLRIPVDDAGLLVTTETTTTKLYALLSDAQNMLFNDMNQRVPGAFMSAPVLLTSSDGGKTYTVKDASGVTINASGHLKVFVRLEDIPDRPLTEGYHYTLEGDLLRIPHNLSWAYATGPYIQPATEPVDITASQALTLPNLCARAVVAQAAVLYCKQGGLRDWDPHERDYVREFAALCTRFRAGATPSVIPALGMTFTRGRGMVGR